MPRMCRNKVVGLLDRNLKFSSVLNWSLLFGKRCTRKVQLLFMSRTEKQLHLLTFSVDPV